MKITRENVKELIELNIDYVDYHHFLTTNHTVAMIKMLNGFTMIGEATCNDDADFKPENGKQYAKSDAINKLIPHMFFYERYSKVALITSQVFKPKMVEPESVIFKYSPECNNIIRCICGNNYALIFSKARHINAIGEVTIINCDNNTSQIAEEGQTIMRDETGKIKIID